MKTDNIELIIRLVLMVLLITLGVYWCQKDLACLALFAGLFAGKAAPRHFRWTKQTEEN